MRALLTITFILSLIAVACSSAKKSQQSNFISAKSEDKVEVLYFQKTSCNGRCPAYVFKLYSDLTCEIDAKVFFIVEGRNSGRISINEYEALLKKMETPDFNQYNDSYNDTLLQDVPATIVGFNHKGKTKKITCVVRTPDSLMKLNSEIEEMIKKVEWKKVAE